MNDQDAVMMRERLSALADGELHGPEVAGAMDFSATEEGRTCWQLYHVVGEALRQGEPAMAHADGALLARLRRQMAQEGAAVRLAPSALQPLAPPLGVQVAHDPAANAQVLRWKLAAGFASLAAVAVLGWNAYVGLGAAPQGAQLAAVPVPSLPAQAVLAASAEGAAQSPGQSPVMIRDPRLDELLTAHRQLGNSTSALQMPAGFLRNATFAGSEH
ncbi:sigma-E factor negative regulatory protein [Pulveribacter suum]|uniref:Anti-anti-sigma factor n=1 Tax=Pulveribacter suum TaxID=2116657 RepID=A0A2P1NJR9_9BURK|nr:sigma-E factor negative regulatory protein [Pulveribacter suum]AVP57240.1 anti-anti-sigma factor [Pulveribacter suum]